MTDVEQLSCQELVELVTDYLEGALTPEEHARFEAHLSTCGGCTRYLEQMRATIALAGGVRPLELDERVEAELLQAFRSWKSGGSRL